MKNEVREVSIHGDGQILYNPAPLRSMTTKADDQMPPFPTTSTFGSCAWYLPGDNKWDDHHAAAETATVVPSLYIEPSVISYNEASKVWRNEGKTYYWPMNGSLTFISWAPYDLGLGKDAGTTFRVTRENGFTITGWTMENKPGYGIVVTTSEGGVTTDPKNVDILLAQNKDCKKTADGKVVPRFSHLLCKVKVEARLAKEDVGEKVIKSVKLTNIYTKGDYVAGMWTNQSEPMDYVYPQASETSPSPTMTVTYKANTIIFPETMFLPQSLMKDTRPEKPKISITLKDNKTTIEGYLNNDQLQSSLSVWNQGKSITYVITIGNETAEIDFTANVDGWSEYDGWIKDGISNIVPVQ